MPPKKIAVVAVASVVIALLLVTLTLLFLRSREDSGPEAGASSAAASEADLFPYDFTESPPMQDRQAVASASFVSISLPDEAGHLTSYGLSARLPAAQDLIAALLAAQPVDTPSQPSSTGAQGPDGPTLTFVLPDRQTLTFSLDLDGGTISRGGQSWRPPGDLRQLIEAATTRP